MNPITSDEEIVYNWRNKTFPDRQKLIEYVFSRSSVKEILGAFPKWKKDNWKDLEILGGTCFKERHYWEPILKDFTYSITWSSLYLSVQ